MVAVQVIGLIDSMKVLSCFVIYPVHLWVPKEASATWRHELDVRTPTFDRNGLKLLLLLKTLKGPAGSRNEPRK